MTKIFVVNASEGEYSDRIEWPIKAFTDEQKAKDFVKELSARSRQAILYNEEITKLMNSLPRLKKEYTSLGKTTSYYTLDIEKAESLATLPKVEFCGDKFWYTEVELD